MADAPLPSSFDNDPGFYEENRGQKLLRRIKEEPLIPLGMALTCWALFGATRSMRRGDSTATNKFFRRRIYAQGFTIAVMWVGSIYWQEDRKKRKEFDLTVEERKKQEKRDAWIRELEARDEEEKAIRRKVEQRRQREHARITEEVKAKESEAAEQVKATEGATAESSKEGSNDSEEKESKSVTEMVKDAVSKR
ncbi:MAG: Respiratory supercomplex factor 1, mitochondrial [Bogoriella megaspora]|nr:MAG: Respiratory supercomplex factor 1, mitochondrial [Bogoriella megaspora]